MLQYPGCAIYAYACKPKPKLHHVTLKHLCKLTSTGDGILLVNLPAFLMFYEHGSAAIRRLPQALQQSPHKSSVQAGLG